MSNSNYRLSFVLWYEGYDRTGTAGFSQELKVTDEDSAIKEALAFLEIDKNRLPKQNHVTIVKQMCIDVSDLKIGKK